MPENRPKSPSTKTLVLATHNQGKVKELEKTLQDFGLNILSLANFPDAPEAEENGQDFTENALIKARAIAAHTGFLALADDSGLCVDALDGRPGLFSARYALLDCPTLEKKTLSKKDIDKENIRKVLAELEHLSEKDRGAHFVCVLALVAPSGEELVATGKWFGEILTEAQGEGGFGYDPIFLDKELGLSAALMEPSVKMARLHRALAVKKLIALWPDFVYSLQK